jgi:mono/diheme cytochrome c family protein
MTVSRSSWSFDRQRWHRLGIAAGALTLAVTLAGQTRATPAAQPQAQPQAPAAATGGLVAQGEYLANRVAMCVQCHTPRDAQGNLLLSERFRGGAIPFTSPWPNREFAYRAPAIAGLPGFTDDDIIMLLTEGHAGARESPRPPMPPFRMTRADAQAIVAYLRTF